MHRRPNSAAKFLVQEMPYAREHHGHAKAVGSTRNHVVVADRTSRLNHGDRPGFGGFFDAIREREECIRRNDASAPGKICSHYRDLRPNARGSSGPRLHPASLHPLQKRWRWI